MKQHPIHFRAEFVISEGKIKEFKKLIKEMSNLVQANEPDTISYQFYFDKPETKCIVLETYLIQKQYLLISMGLDQIRFFQRFVIYLG